jgi:hypothetical protein
MILLVGTSAGTLISRDIDLPAGTSDIGRDMSRGIGRDI